MDEAIRPGVAPDIAPDIAVDAAQVLAGLPNPVFVVDADDRFVYMNNAAEMFFASSRAMLYGSRLDAHILPGSGFFDMLSRSRRQTASLADQGVEIEFPAKGLVRLNVQVAPFGDARAGDGSMILAFQERDFAERMRGNSAFLGAARSVSAMAALMAHEIRNPLAGIKGAAQLLHGDLGKENRELTQMIADESDRITVLLDHMENVAGADHARLGPVNIHEVLDHCLRLATASSAGAIDVTRRYDPSLPDVFGHRDLLVQTFLNIITNAVQAARGTPRLTVATTYSRARRITASGTRRSSVPVQVEVIDSGPGIPPDMKDHIFEPFVSGREGGSGLGLALVAGVVAEHGGLIEVDSAPGRTVFRLSFLTAARGDEA